MVFHSSVVKPKPEPEPELEASGTVTFSLWVTETGSGSGTGFGSGSNIKWIKSQKSKVRGQLTGYKLLLRRQDFVQFFSFWKTVQNIIWIRNGTRPGTGTPTKHYGSTTLLHSWTWIKRIFTTSIFFFFAKSLSISYQRIGTHTFVLWITSILMGSTLKANNPMPVQNAFCPRKSYHAALPSLQRTGIYHR